MSFFRRKLIRRITLFVLLSWGTLTQITIVYACKTQYGIKQMSCCCDQAMQNDCKHQCNHSDKKNCDLDENFGLDTAIPSPTVCCDITYGVTDASVVASNTLTAALKVVLLDAPQPPPMLTNYLLDIVVFGTHTEHFTLHFASLSYKDTYLRTQRFRI